MESEMYLTMKKWIGKGSHTDSMCFMMEHCISSRYNYQYEDNGIKYREYGESGDI
jgi:hypothetical protein